MLKDKSQSSEFRESKHWKSPLLDFNLRVPTGQIFNLPNSVSDRKNPDLSRTKNLIDALSEFHDYDFRKYKGKQPTNKIARNLVDYEAGRTIFETVLGIEKQNKINQIKMF